MKATKFIVATAVMLAFAAPAFAQVPPGADMHHDAKHRHMDHKRHHDRHHKRHERKMHQEEKH